MLTHRLTIGQKIFAIVGQFALVVALLGGTGWWVAATLSHQTYEMDASGRAMVLVARMNTNVQVMTGLQYQLVADPSPVVRERVAKDVERERTLFAQRSAAVVELMTDDTERKLLADLRQGYERYNAAFGQVTVAAANDDRAALAAAAGAAAKEAAAMRETFRAMFKDLEGHEAVLRDDTASIVALSHQIVLGVAVLGLAIGSALAWAVTRWGVSKPLDASVQALERLAAGDLDVQVQGTERRDEIGKVFRAMQVFKERLVHERQLAAETEATRRAEAERAERLNGLTRACEERVGGVLGTVGGEVVELEGTSDAMSSAASGASERAQAAAAAALQAAANVNTVAAAAEELAGSIAEIGRQVTNANAISQQANAQAGHTDALVRSLADTAGQIGDIVDTINAIAHQTNMLALNTTIEAARAGDAGRGFGIVADEVKHLALQTAEATQAIARQVDEVRARVGEAVTAIHTISDIVGQVGEASAGIASAVEEQAAATAEIARNVEQAAQGTQDVSSNIDGVQSAAATTGDAANRVMEIAHGVAGDAQTLKAMVEDFLAGVRAA